MSKNGFTLIELLITITIIVILAAIGIISYQSVLKSGRDSKRQSDLRSIQSALEQYHADEGYFPNPITSDPDGSSLSGPFGRIYLNQIPKDPNGSDYLYQPNSCASGECISYCLYAKLEIPISGWSNPNPTSCTQINASWNFVVFTP